MTPRSFDIATCRELLGDARARVLEHTARGLADTGSALHIPPRVALSYWGMVQEDAAEIVARAAYNKRCERNARKAGASA